MAETMNPLDFNRMTLEQQARMLKNPDMASSLRSIPPHRLFEALRLAGLSESEIRYKMQLAGHADYLPSDDRSSASVLAQVAKASSELFDSKSGDRETTGGADHLAGLSSKPHEQQVQILAEHFALGGTISSAAEAFGASKENVERIREIEDESKAEYERRHAEDKERYEQELRRRGLSEQEARRKAEERFRAEQTLYAAQQVQTSGVLPQKVAQTLVDGARAHRDSNAAVLGMAVKQVTKEATHDARQAALKAAESGHATAEQFLGLKADEVAALGKPEIAAKLAANKELKDFAFRELVKTDGNVLGKELALAALAKGAVSMEKVGEAKDAEMVGAKSITTDTTTAGDDFDLAASSSTVAVADIKSNLAKMRPTDKGNPTGPVVSPSSA